MLLLRKNLIKVLFINSFMLMSFFVFAQHQLFNLENEDLSAAVTTGGIQSLTKIKSVPYYLPFSMFTSLNGCEQVGEVTVNPIPGRGIEFKRHLVHTDTKASCVLTERYSTGEESIHCEIEIQGDGSPWSTSIKTNILYRPDATTRIWMPWSDPRISTRSFPHEEIDQTEQITADQNWVDPFLTRSFFDDTLYYGAPYFKYETPDIGSSPFGRNLFCIPMVTIIEKKEDIGISVILNPDDDIMDLTMQVQSNGSLSFNRLFNRISDKHTLRFSMDVITHEAGWRGGMRWAANHYRAFFNPVNPEADRIAGTGAYSVSNESFDINKMKRMAFTTNWRASYDFPYMGMFIPPVAKKRRWESFGKYPVSIAEMQDYAQEMKNMGFHVLSYFNVTEFGAGIQYPLPESPKKYGKDTWKDANQYLSLKLKDAILRVPDRIEPAGTKRFPKIKPGGFYFTWGDAVAMDCGEPVYKKFLIDQAKEHIRQIPASDGICIDRMDWLRMYNEDRDDGISWYLDRPVRSLNTSWRSLMKEIGALMHENNKSIFVNNLTKRIDLLKEIDGIFDEFTYAGTALNLTAFLTVNKTAFGWTKDINSIKSEGADRFFQKYLYLGVYPMAPFPGNDHSIMPDPWVDQQYEDYGPLLAMMKGKKWVLDPHCVEVYEGEAKVNLFKVPDGWILPVVLGKKEKVTITARNVLGPEKITCYAVYPGSVEKIPLKHRLVNGSVEIEVPLQRGCGMVKIERSETI